jgi:D-alanine-D-alanine ligase-like ATP-grasp enzyme
MSVRSHDNGYRYICDPDNPPTQRTLDNAVAAVGALGLDFGGVDIAWVEKGDKPYVLEVNTAPGLTDMTGGWYAQAFKEKYK